jgi:hypothetical protein
MSIKLFTNYISGDLCMIFKDNIINQNLILTSVEIVWLKWAFFTPWRIDNTTGRKNKFTEAKIANKISVLQALLGGRISGEVSYE